MYLTKENTVKKEMVGNPKPIPFEDILEFALDLQEEFESEISLMTLECLDIEARSLISSENVDNSKSKSFWERIKQILAKVGKFLKEVYLKIIQNITITLMSKDLNFSNMKFNETLTGGERQGMKLHEMNLENELSGVISKFQEAEKKVLSTRVPTSLDIEQIKNSIDQGQKDLDNYKEESRKQIVFKVNESNYSKLKRTVQNDYRRIVSLLKSLNASGKSSNNKLKEIESTVKSKVNNGASSDMSEFLRLTQQIREINGKYIGLAMSFYRDVEIKIRLLEALTKK